MTKKLTYKFKNPNYNSNNQENEWISLWTYSNKNNKIILDNNVELNSASLTNIDELMREIIESNSEHSFWKEVNKDRPGYVPQGEMGRFLYMNGDGQAQWVTPIYEKVDYTPRVIKTSVFNKVTQQLTPSEGSDEVNLNEDITNVLIRNGNSTTDRILNLTYFLYDIGVTLMSNTNNTQIAIDNSTQG